MSTRVRVGFPFVALVVFLAAPGLPEAALVNPVSQERTVSANVGSPDGTDSDSDSAADFGVFDTSVSASVTGPNGNLDATASQLSVILTDRVTGEAAVTGSSTGTFPGGDGHARFSLIFDLFQPVDYQLDFFLRAFSSIGDQAEATGFLELKGGAGDQIIARFDVNGQDPQIESGPVSGVLAAGRYELRAGTDVFPSPFGTAEGSFDFDFTVVPEPSTALLAALGLLALGAMRRRRGQS